MIFAITLKKFGHMHVRWRRLAALVLVAAIFGDFLHVGIEPVFAGGGDFQAINLSAAAPQSYDHATGGGAWDDATNGVDEDIVTSLTGGDFACGDTVTFFAKIVVEDTQSAADDAPQTIELSFSFLADSTGQSGAAIGDITQVMVNYGTVQDLIEGDHEDTAISDNGNSVATVLSESLTGPLFQSGSEVLLTVEINNLERNETVILRVDAVIFCEPGTNPSGVLQAGLTDAQLTGINGTPLPEDQQQAIGGGAQTLPFIQIGDIEGTGEPLLKVTKTVTTADGACPGVETLTIVEGETVLYCFTIENPGTHPLFDVALVDDNGTPDDTSDDFTVVIAPLSDLDGQSDLGDLVAGGSVSGAWSVTIPNETTVVNTATGTGNNGKNGGQFADLTDDDTATVIAISSVLPITVAYFLAAPGTNGVTFFWQTATETGNAGFNLFADTDGDLVQINDELIPSTVIDSVEPTDYSYTAVTPTTVFYIEDVSITGATDRLGPFTLGTPAGLHTAIDVEFSHVIWLPVISN